GVGDRVGLAVVPTFETAGFTRRAFLPRRFEARRQDRRRRRNDDGHALRAGRRYDNDVGPARSLARDLNHAGGRRRLGNAGIEGIRRGGPADVDLHWLLVADRDRRFPPSPGKTGPVWGPRGLHPSPGKTGPVWGPRGLRAGGNG